MQNFLSKVANYLINKYSNNISNICIVLPSKRAVNHIKKELAHNYGKPFFLPTCYSIDDFFTIFSPYQIATPEEQLLLLYRIYTTQVKDKEPLIKFAPQAKMMLQDFNEIDLDLVDANALFNNLQDIEEISFWNRSIDELSDFQKKQYEFFHKLYEYYTELKKCLHAENLSYQGDTYRFVAENAEEIFKHTPYTKIVFVGFNALSKSEKKVLKTLKNKELLDFIVDADQFYTDKHTHEAGQFIREIQDELFDNQQLNFIDNYFNPKDPSEKKHIKIISVAQPILQTKILPQILKPLKDSTIIVPNDETLLPALLQSYDWTKAKANITMSYNIKKTLICQLFDTIFTIVENQELLSEHHICYATDINAFFDNGIINSILTKRHQEKSTTKIFYNKEDFHEIFTTDNTLATLCGQLFFDENDNVQFLTKLKTFVALLNNNPNINFDDIDKEILQQLDLYFDKLLSLISTKDDNLVADKASLKFLFNSFITNIALSFQSDADNNLQLMGMLESRTLDFDNVILLSVNENILPNNSRNKTFIPFDLRKHFGMQTFDSKDAVSAYHFYRLLQRAKNIFLIYSLENGNRESAEKSRFIMQIEQELCDYCTIDNESFNLDFVKTTQNQAIKIPKNQNIIKTLSKCSFSASNLNDYLQCNLKFYFSNILKINEIKNKQYISDDTFGTVIHRYFEEFDWADFKLPSQDDIKNRVLNLYKDQKYALHDLEIANNYIIVQVTIKYIYDYLKFYNQHRQTIDNVIDKEKKIELSIDLQNTKQIKLKGILDRIDEQNGQIIINDYKTGSIKPSDCSIKDLDIETLSKKPKTFQLLFYTYLYRQSKQCSNLQARIISLRNINIEIPLTIKGQTNIDQNIFNEFQKILEAIFMDMFDITKDFAMTDDEKKCIYCPYATICGRETTNGF